MRTAIYIDDTGTPGNISKSIYDTNDRKSWVALILNPEERKEANVQMLGCLDELKRLLNANEFHFTDIYSGRKEFEGVDFKVRLNIFREFAEIHRKTQFPMIIQTFTSDDILRNRISVNGNVKVDNFDLSKTDDFALFFLLFRIKKYFKENKHIVLPFDLIIDEGRQKKNTIQKCDLLNGLLYNNEIMYKSSKEEPLLQLIDFVAFTINRVRWILTNDKKSDLDFEFLNIANRANFNIINIVKREIEFSNHTVEDYDNLLREIYDKNNNLPEIQLEELKNHLKK